MIISLSTYILTLLCTVVAAYQVLTPMLRVRLFTLTSSSPMGELPLTTVATSWYEYGLLDGWSWIKIFNYGYTNGAWQYTVFHLTGVDLPIPTMSEGMRHVADACLSWFHGNPDGLITGVVDAAPCPTKATYPFRARKATHAP